MRTLFEIGSEMKEIAANPGDREAQHDRADELLIEAVEELARLSFKTGIASVIVDDYRRVEKWYA